MLPQVSARKNAKGVMTIAIIGRWLNAQGKEWVARHMTEIPRTAPTTVTATAKPAGATIRRFQPFSSLVRVDVSALSHVGLVRETNEDQYLVARLTRRLESMLTSLPAGDVPEIADEVNYVMAVADGMGGHAAGEVASRLVLSAAVSLALEVPDWAFKITEGGLPAVERRARQLVQQVGSILIERADQDPALHGMGSTLTAVRSYGRDLLIVHVGDSRAYMCRGGRLHKLTRDHTYVQMLLDTGQLASKEEAPPRIRHVLVNVLGGSTEHVDVDVDLVKLEDGDRLLLCSDGLTDLVDDETIAALLTKAPSSHDACASLLALALERGGRDNITVVAAVYAMPAAGSPVSL
jgi:protein phosphatase